MKRYVITVNGRLLESGKTVEANSASAAIDKWLIDKYGSVFCSSAPYNINAFEYDSCTHGWLED